MALAMTCPCGQHYPDVSAYAGLQVLCPLCNRTLTVPSGTFSAPLPVHVHRPPAIPGPIAEEAQPGHRGALLALLVACFLLLLAAGGVLAVVLLLPRSGSEAPHAEGPPPGPISPPAEGASTPSEPKKGPPPADSPPPTLERPALSPDPWRGHRSPILNVAVTADGKHVLTGSGGLKAVGEKLTLEPDNSLRRWEAKTGKELQRRDGFPTGIGAVAFSPDGHFAALATAGVLRDGAWERGVDNDVQLYSLAEKKSLRSFRGHTKEVLCVAFSADGLRVLSGSADHTVRLWDVGTGRELQELKGHTNAINQVAFSPDGKLALSAGADHTARLWDLNEGRELRQAPEHKDVVWTVAFSPDGRTAASGGGKHNVPGVGFTAGARDFDVRLFDVDTGKELKRLPGHADAVSALAFSRDGRRLLSGSHDGAVRLWQVESARELRCYASHAGQVRALAFFPKGRRAASVGEDMVVRILGVPPDVPELVRDLRSDDPAVRSAALTELSYHGADARPALPALLEALASGESAFRDRVLTMAKALGPVPAEDAGKLLPLLKQRGHRASRYFALEALAALGAEAKSASKELVLALADSDAGVRKRAAKALGAIGPEVRPAALPKMLEALRDADVDVQAEAVAALGKLGAPARAELPLLRRMLSDRGPAVRRYSIKGLADLGAEANDALPDLLDRCRDEPVGEVRALAVAAVAAIAPARKEAVAAFARALSDDDPTVSRQAVQGLVAGKPDGVGLPGLLLALGHGDATVSKTADEALSKVKFGKEHVKALAAALSSKQAPVRTRAVTILGELGADAEEAVPAMCVGLKGGTPAERGKVLEALGKLGPAAKEAGPALAGLLKEKDRNVRLQVSLVLAGTGAREVEHAVPILVALLKAEDLEQLMDEDAMAERDKAAKALVQIGPPAVLGLVEAIERDFRGGAPLTPRGQLNGAARLTAVQVLTAIGPKGRSNRLMLMLAKLQREDPFVAVKKAAQAARVAMSKEK